MFQNVYAPEKDPELTVERYERTWDQNESLGLNDIKTENYGEKEEEAAEAEEHKPTTCKRNQEQVES